MQISCLEGKEVWNKIGESLSSLWAELSGWYWTKMNHCTDPPTCVKILVHWFMCIRATFVWLQISNVYGLVRMLPVRGEIILFFSFKIVLILCVCSSCGIFRAGSVILFYSVLSAAKSCKYLPCISKHAVYPPNSFFNFLSSLLSASLFFLFFTSCILCFSSSKMVMMLPVPNKNKG